jgi:glutamine synthetase
MVGSTQSVSGPSFVLNTIVADALGEIADELEKADDASSAAQKLLQDIAVKHAKVVFNGDNYAPEWVTEAEGRGLPNIRSTVESLKSILSKENIELFSRHGVLSEHELRARTEVLLEAYSMQINIEAETMLNMVKRQILPSCCAYSAQLGNAVVAVASAGVGAETQTKMLKRVCELIATLERHTEALEKVTAQAASVEESEAQAESYRDDVVPVVAAVRTAADELETVVDAKLWPLPVYAEMLFVR